MKEVQAEAIVRAIKESRDFDFSRLATKDQLKNVEQKLVAEIKTVEERLRGEIKASETTVIKWIFAAIIPMAGLLVHIAIKLPS
jgi:phosphopantetheine adenylyltransferase